MKFIFACAVLSWALLSFAPAAEQKMTGKISDSMCGATHKTMAEHGTSKMSARDCTLACVKNGGKYVFVSAGKVYQIQNQDFVDLEKHAGHTVKLSGDATGDSVVVSKIEMTAQPKGKKAKTD